MIADFIWLIPGLNVYEAIYRATPEIGGKPSPVYKAVRDLEIEQQIRKAGGSQVQVTQAKREVERIDALNAAQPDAGLTMLKRLAMAAAVTFIAYHGFKLYLEYRRSK